MGQGGRQVALAMYAAPMQTQTEGFNPARNGIPRQGGSTYAGDGYDSPIRPQRLNFEQHLYSPQEGLYQTPSRYQPEMGQFPHQEGTFQNVYYEGRQAGADARLLHGQAGPERLFLGPAPIEAGPKSSGLQMEGDQLRLQVPSLRPITSPDVYYQAVPPRGGVSTSSRSSSDDIHRRFANSRREQAKMRRLSPGDFGIDERPRSCGKRRKVVLLPGADSKLLGLLSRLQDYDSNSPPQQDPESQETNSNFTTTQSGFSSRPSVYFGQDQRDGRRAVSCPSSHEPSTRAQAQDIRPWPRLGPVPEYYDERDRRFDVVGRQHLLTQWAADKRARGESTSHDGRFRLRLGGDDQEDQRKFFEELGRHFFEGNFDEAYKLQRTFGNSLPNQEFPYTPSRTDGRLGGGQHNSSILHQQHGGPQAAPRTTSGANLRSVSSESREAHRVSPTGDVEPSSGLGITQNSIVRASGLSAAPLPLQEDRQGFRAPLNRRVRDIPKQTDPKVRNVGTSARSDLDRLDEPVVEGRERLGKSSLLPDRQDPSQDKEGEGDDNNFSPTLASSDLVSPTSSDVDRATPPPPGDEWRVYTSDGRKQNPQVAHSRMEGLRAALAEKGIHEATFDVMAKAWEPATLRNYEVYWRRWDTFAREKGKDPFTTDHSSLAAWLAELVSNEDSLAKEGAVEKARTVIRSTWALLDDPYLVSDKISKAAAKANGPKKKGKYKEIWDINYAFQMMEGLEYKSMNFRDFMENFILKIKTYTGWRADDLHGMYIEHSFKWHMPEDGGFPGVYIKHYNAKNRQREWSQELFLPCLAPDYQLYCPYRIIKELEARLAKFEIKQVDVYDGEGISPLWGTPVFNWQADDGTIQRMAAGTISSYYKKTLLDQVEAPIPGRTLGDYFTGHSVRHAVASALYEYDVQPLAIARHVGCTQATLEKTYVRPVERHWHYPEACVKAQPWLALKLMVPHVHWTSYVRDKKNICDCTRLHGLFQDFSEGEVRSEATD